MTWTLISTDLPNEIKTRKRGCELIELGTTNFRVPLFKANKLATSGFSNTEIPVDNSLSEGYTPVVDTDFELEVEDTLLLFVVNGSYAVDSYTQIFNLNNVIENSYLVDNNTTYIFTKSTSFVTNVTLFLEVPAFNDNFSFDFDLSQYDLDDVSLIDVEALTFVPTFNNDIATIEASSACRPFAGQLAVISGTKTVNVANSTVFNGLVFDLTTLNLDYIDSIDYLNQSYIFSNFPTSGSLTYNANTKRVYLWQ